jgi:hypothetical protein
MYGPARPERLSRTPFALIPGALVLAATAVLMTAAAVSALETAAQVPPATEPLVVVENFLADRAAGDAWGAAGWCAPLLELQDVDGEWFVDGPTTSHWLRQLSDKYLLDTLVAPIANGDTVTWTERLTPRGIPFPAALRSSMRIEVHAVIRDNKIGYLSGPYPAITLGRPGQPSDDPDTSRLASRAASIAPATLFVGSALGLTGAALLAAWGGPAVGALWQRRRPKRTAAARPLHVRTRRALP